MAEIITWSSKISEKYGNIGTTEAEQLPFMAKKEVIFAAGSIYSPLLLVLSRIGYAQGLKELGFPPVHRLFGIGKHPRDRLFAVLVTLQKLGSHHRTSYIDGLAPPWRKRRTRKKNTSWCSSRNTL